MLVEKATLRNGMTESRLGILASMRDSFLTSIARRQGFQPRINSAGKDARPTNYNAVELVCLLNSNSIKVKFFTNFA